MLRGIVGGGVSGQYTNTDKKLSSQSPHPLTRFANMADRPVHDDHPPPQEDQKAAVTYKRHMIVTHNERTYTT